ncbi:hypothetical protein BV898_07082 [Hypsibius exemplaris]|uniref:SnoaL-like domain-containing protein n=1 Tax=Hypsibius exemplaris TaxID=2072580 RepID=A0A1W0WUE6_HYPEX|nr:hypothetical protein BV898_07082 [Hypsibius exemplaris]
MTFLLTITCFMALTVTSGRAGLINAPDSGVGPWGSRNIRYKWLGKDVGEIAMLKDAMAQISLDTGYCINFTDITASSSPDRAYLQIKPVNPGTTMCYSRAGYAGNQSVATCGPQTMVAFSSRTGNPIGACLDSKREAMRLLTRVLGVMDEFRKPSRNTVMTFPKGFQPGLEQLNLLSRYVEHYDIFGVERVNEEYPDAVDATPGVFDALSVTMVSGTRYAADPKKPVFTVAGNVKVGDLARLSLLDCKTVTKLYGCSSAVCIDPYAGGISMTVPPMPRPTNPVPAGTNKKLQVVNFLKAFETGAQEPLSVINPNKFIEHDPAGFDGLAGVKGLQKALNGTARVNTVRVFQDGDYVFTHTDYDFFGPKFAFDILRFEGDHIVEHWDNLQTKPTQPNPSGHTMIDGPTQPESNVPTSVVCSNKEAVRKFLEDVFVNGRIDRLENYLDFSVVQHNPLMGDGLMGWLNGTRTAAKEGRSLKYTRVYLVLGDGNFVLTQSEGLQAVQPVAIYDLFRLKNGRIAEHWDVIQEIPPVEKFNHKNGKF